MGFYLTIGPYPLTLPADNPVTYFSWDTYEYKLNSNQTGSGLYKYISPLGELMLLG